MLSEEYLSIYKPLLDQFIKDINGINPHQLPAPFLPFFGKKYEETNYKIAFVGWETRDSVSLPEFLQKFKDNSDQVYYWFNEDLEYPFYFIDYKYINNPGNNFWGFIFRFLAKFYGLTNWKELKQKSHPEILESFVWGNVDSLERFEASDRHNANLNDYHKVKKASKIFDKSLFIYKTFRPKILVLLYGSVSERWLIENVEKFYGPEKIDPDSNLIDYYYIQDYDTHVYWTYHPIQLIGKTDYVVSRIVLDIFDRRIFASFPGEKRIILLNDLKRQLETKAEEYGLEVIEKSWGNGGESYFSFSIPSSRNNAIISLCFDKGYDDFSIGVYLKGENYTDECKHKLSEKLTLLIGNDIKYPNWAYLHYFHDDWKNWSLNEKIWRSIPTKEVCNILFDYIQLAAAAVHELNI